MYVCECGKEFLSKISCSRHKSTCKGYRESRSFKIKPKEFIEEGKDHILCMHCGYKARDITRHLVTALPPHPSFEEYRNLYPGCKIVCSDVDQKRKRTSKALHGDPNYRNKEAQRAGVIRAFNESDVLGRIRKTKQDRYGNPGFVNIEKRKRTLLDRYGVDNPMKNPETVKKALETRKILYKDNPIYRKPLISKEELEERHHIRGQSLDEIARDLNITPKGVSYWMKKHGVSVCKRVMIPKNKEYITPDCVVKEYLEACKESKKLLSFTEFGIMTEDKKKQRLKRLFNSGKKYHHLREELKEIALKPGAWEQFLGNFS